MDRKNYLRDYKQYHYNKTRKIVTFPLLVEDYEALKLQADAVEVKVNKFVKELILAHIEKSPHRLISKEKLTLIQSYIRVSRGIANNINQIAYNSNIGEYIDVSILINALKRYEDEFRALIHKL